MEDRVCEVSLVVAAEFDGPLIALANRMPVWIADTPGNRAGIQAARLAGGDLTVFRVDEGKSPDGWASEVVATVVEHHGEWSHDPPLSRLEIFGASLTPQLRDVLSEYGFSETEMVGGSIRASSRPAT